jgi:DNA-binding NarL/FixJ family response regulator
MKKHVAIIDDDTLVMNAYEAALSRRGFDVTRFSGEDCVDRAVQCLEANPSTVDLAVVDVMMPPGETFRDSATDDGMKTGVFLLERLKANCPELRFLVLTNVQNEETLQELRRVAPGTTVLRKAHCPPFDLVEKVQELIASPK